MPRLNARGQALMGTGGLPGSLDGVLYPFATDGSGVWLDDYTILLQLHPQSVLALWSARDPGVQPQIIQPPRGSNGFAAGSGRWIASLWDSRPGGFRGTYGTLGDLLNTSVIGAAPDGTLAYCPSQPTGLGMIIVNPDGTRLDLDEGKDHPTYYPNPQILGAGKAIWQGGAIGRAPIRPALGNSARLCTVAGVDWLTGWENDPGVGVQTGQLFAQVDGELEGWVLETRPMAFGVDQREVNGKLRIAWSLTSGEGPGDLVVCEVTRHSVDFLTDPQGDARPLPVWGLLVAHVPPVVVPTIAPFNHPVLVQVFRPYPGSTGADDIGTGIGIVSEAVDPTADLARAAAQHTRLLLIHDSDQPWTLPAGMPACTIPILELYRYKTPAGVPKETLVQTGTRWFTAAMKLLNDWPGDCGFDPQLYCMGGAKGSVPPELPELWTEQEVLAGLVFLSDLVNLSTRFKLLVPFEDDRPNGIRKHPPFLTAFKAMQAASPGRPTFIAVGVPHDLPPHDPPPPPPPPHDPPKEPPVPQPTDEELTAAFAAIGVVATKALHATGDTGQGVRQSWDQNHKQTLSDFVIAAAARANGATPEEINAAVAATRLLQGA